MRAATADYRDAMDLVGRFVADCCVVGPELSAGATAPFKRFKQWCDETGEHALNQTRFGSRLTERGFEAGQVGGGRVMRRGIGILDDGSL